MHALHEAWIAELRSFPETQTRNYLRSPDVRSHRGEKTKDP